MKTNNPVTCVTTDTRRVNRLNLSSRLEVTSKFLILSVFILITACAPTPPTTCSKGELDFEPPAFVAGTTYSVIGSLHNNGNGLAVVLDSITYVSGLRGFNKSIILPGAPHPFGTNQILRMNNARLSFDLKQNTQNAEFEYLDYGGTINLGARGWTNLFVGNMSALPASTTINGVTVKKSNVVVITNPQGIRVAEKGTITLSYTSDIGGMVIGG